MAFGNEFIDCGPRRVWEDERGYFIKYDGYHVYAQELSSYLGQKVHVVADLTGAGWSIHEWLPYSVIHVGGWRTRAGHCIKWWIPSEDVIKQE